MNITTIIKPLAALLISASAMTACYGEPVVCSKIPTDRLVELYGYQPDYEHNTWVDPQTGEVLGFADEEDAPFMFNCPK